MKVTQKTLDLLAEKKVYTSYDGTSRLKVGDDIFVNANTLIEPYSMFSGNRILSMGSFSYSWTQMREDTIIGRYSSIAAANRTFGPQHPYERFTSSSVTLDRGFVIFSKCVNSVEKNGFITKPIPTPPA